MAVIDSSMVGQPGLAQLTGAFTTRENYQQVWKRMVDLASPVLFGLGLLRSEVKQERQLEAVQRVIGNFPTALVGYGKVRDLRGSVEFCGALDGKVVYEHDKSDIAAELRRYEHQLRSLKPLIPKAHVVSTFGEPGEALNDGLTDQAIRGYAGVLRERDLECRLPPSVRGRLFENVRYFCQEGFEKVRQKHTNSCLSFSVGRRYSIWKRI